MPLETTSQVVIDVDQLDKSFRFVSDRPETLKTALVKILTLQVKRKPQQKFEVLKNVSFQIRRGDFVGIMGRNGAGKSTLLKLLCGIYTPTAGKIQISDRVAPLIELGAGFNPELSGLENIYLNAAILGFGRAQTKQAVPDILEFCELGQHIHAPVKNYSSGMLVRLGFSIATHLEAPILLVDEVLAVGDVGFQEKCLKKIHELHSKGRTIVLITHSPEAVKQHCNRCIVIDEHTKVFDGAPEEGANLYIRRVSN
ncbi:ABC transporter ATP-binding protein [bacterium]|nr:ABC transporter ATP-binding protein [bacterium]